MRALVLLLLVACNKSQESAPAPKPSARPPSDKYALPMPSTTPCTTDAECMVWMNPCDCTCNGVLAPGPQVSKEEWSKQCGDNSGRNCGAAYPCMNMKATCDAATKTCGIAH